MIWEIMKEFFTFIGGMTVLLTVLAVIWIEGFGKAGRRGGRTEDEGRRPGVRPPYGAEADGRGTRG